MDKEKFINLTLDNFVCIFSLLVSHTAMLLHAMILRTEGWQNLNPLSHPNATLAPKARASGENLNYVTLRPQARPSG